MCSEWFSGNKRTAAALGFRALCRVVVPLLLCAAPALGNDFVIKPAIGVTGEYTDNVFSSRDKREEFITRVMPGFNLIYKASLWDWDLGYALDYRKYVRNSADDELSHAIDAKGNMRLIDNFLFLDLTDTYQRASLEVYRDRTAESILANQSDQNILNVRPFITVYPRKSLQLKTGYSYRRETYFNPREVRSSTQLRGIDREEHGGYAVTTWEMTPKLSLNAEFSYSHVMPSEGALFDIFTPSVGISYQYADKSFATLQAGYSWFRFENLPSGSDPYWNAGITHVMDSVTASVNALVRYNSDPVRSTTEERVFTAKLENVKEKDSCAVLVNYFELRDTTADLLLSTRFLVEGNVRHALTRKVAVRLDLSGEKVDTKNISDFTPPYRYLVSGGLSYMMADNLTLSLDYTYVLYQESIGNSANNIQINRAVVGLNKSFF